MRENPTPHADPSQQTYAGDNFVRHSGAYKDFTQVQRFAWDASRSGGGTDVVPVANPSQAELLHKQFREKKGIFFFFVSFFFSIFIFHFFAHLLITFFLKKNK